MTSSSSCSALPSTFVHAVLNSTSPISSSILLPDGRNLSFRAYGQGFPVIFIPGQFNSRLFDPAFPQTTTIAQQCSARIIQLERPGYGQSSGPPSPSYLSFAADVAHLVHQLRIDTLSLLGFSSGGPFALACASLLGPLKVHAAILASSDGPYADLASARQTVYPSPASPELIASRFAALQETYRAVGDPVKRAACLEDLAEASRQGLDAPLRDSQLETSAWGFDLALVHSAVALFASDADAAVPLACSQFLAGKLPRARLVCIHGESHAGVVSKRHLASLLAAAVPPLQQPLVNL